MGPTTDTEAMIVENELGLYEGCYVELKNGEIHGPLENDGDRDYPWNPIGKTAPSWTDSGKVWVNPGRKSPWDIVRVLPPKGATAEPQTDPAPVKQGVSEAVLKAAMDAGIRAKPAYEDFVTAIVQAAFAEAGKPVALVERRPVDRTKLLGILMRQFYELSIASPKYERNWGRLIDELIEFFSAAPEAKNESAPGSNAVRKNEGGQSDLEDISPSEYHGITSAEQERLIDKIRLNAEYPRYAPSRLHFYDPKLTDEITASAQGTLGAPSMAVMFIDVPAPDHDELPFIRSMDKLHPALRAFLDAINPTEAPLRAVEMIDSWTINAGYGRPMKPSHQVIVRVDGADIPMWTEDGQPEALSEPVVNLVEPEGWYLDSAMHLHECHQYADQTVVPLPHAEGPWIVLFQKLHNGGCLTHGRGHNLCEAWENAVKAVAERQS